MSVQFMFIYICIYILVQETQFILHCHFIFTYFHGRLGESVCLSQARSLLKRINDVMAALSPGIKEDRSTGMPYGYHGHTPSPSSFAADVLEPLFFSRVFTVLMTLYRLNTQVSLVLSRSHIGVEVVCFAFKGMFLLLL